MYYNNQISPYIIYYMRKQTINNILAQLIILA